MAPDLLYNVYISIIIWFLLVCHHQPHIVYRNYFLLKLEIWWLNVRDMGVAHCKIYDCLLLGIWWLIVSYVVAHCWRCGGSLLGIWWLITSYVVAHC